MTDQHRHLNGVMEVYPNKLIIVAFPKRFGPKIPHERFSAAMFTWKEWIGLIANIHDEKNKAWVISSHWQVDPGKAKTALIQAMAAQDVQLELRERLWRYPGSYSERLLT